MSEDYKKEIDRLIKAAGVKAVNRISEPIRVEDAFQPKRRKTLKETIKVIADTPEEAQAFMALLQNAGIEQEMPQGDEMEPSDELPQPQGDELPQDGGPPCGMEAEAEGEIAQGADYANSPDEEYEDDPMNTYSTKWNHQKKFRRTNNHGDNPLSLADSLMREWTDVRDTKETEEVIDPRIKDRQVGEDDGGDADVLQAKDQLLKLKAQYPEYVEGYEESQSSGIITDMWQNEDFDLFEQYWAKAGLDNLEGTPPHKGKFKDYYDDDESEIHQKIEWAFDNVKGNIYDEIKKVTGQHLPHQVFLSKLKSILPNWEEKSEQLHKIGFFTFEQVGEDDGGDEKIKQWAEKYKQYKNLEGDNLIEALYDYAFDLGITQFIFEVGELQAAERKLGKKQEDWGDAEIQAAYEMSPISEGLRDELNHIVPGDDLEAKLEKIRPIIDMSEELNRIKELSGIDKQVGEDELKRYGNYRRRN